MRRKPQELVAGFLLLLSFAFYWPHLANALPNLVNILEYPGISFIFEGLEEFLWFIAEFLYVTVPFIALIAGILALIGKRKGASILAGLSLCSMFLASCLKAFMYLIAGSFFEYGVLARFNELVLGRYGEYYVSNAENQWFAYAPVATLLIVSSILLFTTDRGNAKSVRSINFQTPAPFEAPQIPVAPVVVGMKKCPDCAELIQGEAVKCRFCNYRYE